MPPNLNRSMEFHGSFFRILCLDNTKRNPTGPTVVRALEEERRTVEFGIQNGVVQNLVDFEMAASSQVPGGISPFFLDSSSQGHCGGDIEWSQASSSLRTGATGRGVGDTKMLTTILSTSGPSAPLLFLASYDHTTWKGAH